MKIAIACALVIASVTGASAQLFGQNSGGGLSGTGSNPSSHYVQPHITSNGSSVQGHYATNPNSTQLDNYSTRGNLNPYTGAVGCPFRKSYPGVMVMQTG
jgi:hypothetical protein